MGANPHANGGLLHRPLDLPDTTRQAQPEGAVADPARALGGYLRDVLERDGRHRDIRLFSPDETVSGRLGAVYEVTRKQWQAELVPGDPHLGRNGRVVEVVSAHLCQGLAEGYVRTGRHALVCCQEAVAPQLAAMTETHLGWLRTHRGLAWRPPVPALTYLLTTQDRARPNPGFADHLLAGEAGPLRVYLPPDANTLLAVARHCLAEPDVVNLIVAGGQATPTLFDPEAAELHCARGAGIIEDAGDTPDVVLAGAGAAETVEALAAAALLRDRRPEVRVRVVNVVDLLRLLPSTEHVRGLTDLEFDSLFTADAPVIFAYHGHSWLIHRLAGRRGGLLVRGHRGAGAGTTPFDALVRNDLDRYRLAVDVIDRVPGLRASAALLRQDMIDRREHHRRWIREHGEDLPEVREWAWQRATGPGSGP
jgi:xylulose-5-phosphate/fructose-6-phosphate phosphoketolase